MATSLGEAEQYQQHAQVVGHLNVVHVDEQGQEKSEQRRTERLEESHSGG